MPDFSILQPVDVGGMFQRGFGIGMTLTKQAQTHHALQNYLANPDDERALGALAFYDPDTARNLEGIRQHRLAAQQEAQDRQRRVALGGLYASGDTAGAQQEAIAAGDFDLAKTFSELDKPNQSKLADFYKTAAPLAYKMRQMPDPQQRQQFLDAARPLLHAHGITDDMINQLDVSDDTQLDAYITGGQTVDQLIEQGKIHWQTVPGEGGSAFAVDSMGRPIGKNNPYAGGGGGAPSSGGTSGNNPGGLRKPGSMEFQRFGSEAEGIQAQEGQIARYMSGQFNGQPLNTVSAIVETYAPRKSRGGDNSEASVNNYIQYVSNRLGVQPGQPLPADAVPQIAQAMREFETGKRGSGQLRVAATGGVPHVASKADYDRLPKGMAYIAPDGSRRVKG